MKKLLLLVPLVLLLISCSERESDQQESVQRVIDSEQLEERSGVYYVINEEKPFSGKMTGFHKNGKQSAEATYTNGIPQGMFRQWYENGQLKTEVNLVNGQMDGLLRMWQEDGQLTAETVYVNGKEVN